MLSDRTLLSVTLAATFAAGGASGWMARDLRSEIAYQPTRAESVYSRQLRTLREAGYDESEMGEAVRLHQEYLDTHHLWWQAFLEDQRRNFDAVDRKFEMGMEDLGARVKARLAAAGTK